MTDKNNKSLDLTVAIIGYELGQALMQPLQMLLLDPKVTIISGNATPQQILRQLYKNVPKDFDKTVADPNKSVAMLASSQAWQVRSSYKYSWLIALIFIGAGIAWIIFVVHMANSQ